MECELLTGEHELYRIYLLKVKRIVNGNNNLFIISFYGHPAISLQKRNPQAGQEIPRNGNPLIILNQGYPVIFTEGLAKLLFGNLIILYQD